MARELRREFQPSTPGGPLKVAVGRLNLVLNHGECFGLLGENGAGKTTLIKMLGASLAPTSGSAHICGFSTQTETAQVHILSVLEISLFGALGVFLLSNSQLYRSASFCLDWKTVAEIQNVFTNSCKKMTTTSVF